MKKNLYIAPEVEVLDVMVEAGYTISAGGGIFDTDDEELD